MKNLSSKIKKDPNAFADFAELIDSDQFKEKIKDAAQDPESDTAKEVVGTVLPILQFGKKRNPLGSSGDSASATNDIARQNHF